MNRAFLAFAAGVVIVTLMLAGAIPAAGLAALIERSAAVPAYAWVLLAPLLYLTWLATFLRIAAAVCHRMGTRHPKPRYLVLRAGDSGASDERGMLTVGVCYRLYALLHSTPFVSLFAQLPYLKTLVFRAYAPSCHIDESAIVMGRVLDPDLTHIARHAVVGGNAAVVAHSMVFRPTGERVYVSAPISIGARATVGGESLVMLGCVLGDDAVVEPGSVVEPFTEIGARDVWGGNPARFKRTRDDVDAAAAPQTALPVAPAPTDVPAPGDAVRKLVVDALELTPAEVSAPLSADTCARWDSLGQVAIAAAIFDRYSITVAARDVFHVRSLDDVAAAIDGRPIAAPARPSQSASRPPEAPPAPAADVVERPADPEMLPLLDPQHATRLLASAEETPGRSLTPVRLTVAASFTAHSIERPLKLWGRAFGFDIGCHFAGYDQILSTLLDMPERRRGITVVLTRLEDVVTDPAGTDTTYIDQVLDAVARAAAQRAPGDRLLVATLPPVVSTVTAPNLAGSEALRHRWRSRLDATSGVEVFEFGTVIERIGAQGATDPHAEILTRAPYAPRAYQEVAIALVRQIRSPRGAPAKVIALDCDNTLWGGVVGEVGIGGIDLGRDGAGRSFRLFQQQLKRLKDRGFLLVVASKNEEHDVRHVFEDHPEMVLRPDDIAAWRVNWRHKSDSLREMAQELNVGLDSFVFLDDDPVSRTEVASRVPAVHVVPMPADPALYCETLGRLWLFDGAAPTTVDAARTQMAKQEQQRQEERGASASLDEFLASLDLKVAMSQGTDADWPRVAQLTQRTNQFNLSLKRRSAEEVQALARTATVVGLRARDRFGDYGQVGVCVLGSASDPACWEIDTLLMSCRALGRGVEDALMYGIATIASERGAVELVAPFVEGPRNAQVKDYLARCGFEDTGGGIWRRSLDEPPVLPAHVQFERHMTETTLR